MTRQMYRLCETVADLADHWNTAPFRPGDSREQVQRTIEWADDFQTTHASTPWGVDGNPEYYEAVQEHFTIKYREWLLTQVGLSQVGSLDLWINPQGLLDQSIMLDVEATQENIKDWLSARLTLA